MGPFRNDYGDCQVPIQFEASRFPQTDSEVWFQFDMKLDWQFNFK